MSEVVYIGLGANLNEPLATVRLAIEALKTLPDSEFLAVSQIYRSAPMGPADQPDYINCAVALQTTLSAEQLFELTCAIEQKHGRTRDGEHWGPRTLDLDILLFGNHIIDTDQLTIPHYGMKQREFVIYPLMDITPKLVLPCGTSLLELSKQLSLNGMTPVN